MSIFDQTVEGDVFNGYLQPGTVDRGVLGAIPCRRGAGYSDCEDHGRRQAKVGPCFAVAKCHFWNKETKYSNNMNWVFITGFYF